MTVSLTRYAMYVHDNARLEQLWSPGHKISVAKVSLAIWGHRVLPVSATPLTNTHPSRLQGAAVFLSNPRLCPELITRLAAANKLRQLRLPPSLVATLNGDAVACE